MKRWFASSSLELEQLLNRIETQKEKDSEQGKVGYGSFGQAFEFWKLAGNSKFEISLQKASISMRIRAIISHNMAQELAEGRVRYFEEIRIWRDISNLNL